MDRTQEVIEIIEANRWRMGAIKLVSDLGLPDWWVGAGFVRNAIWDHLHGKPMTPLRDIDVIYFDAERTEAEIDENLCDELGLRGPKKPWTVHNQARMHLENGHPPYTSSLDALRRWTETATAIAITLDAKGKLVVAAPYGVDDALDLIVRPTSPEVTELVKARAEKKRWAKIWPKLTFVY
jgi:uncharacterized protein